MSKYANLPDIDTEAPDVYETEDVFPSSSVARGDSSDDEQPTRAGPSGTRGRSGVSGADKDELDTGNLVGHDAASRHFRRAERRQRRTYYAYPPSPSTSDSDDHLHEGDEVKPKKRVKNPAQRLASLRAEIAALEADLADPERPRAAEGEDPGALLQGLVDVKGRLEKIRAQREGRGKLVGMVTGEGGRESAKVDEEAKSEETKEESKEEEETPAPRSIAEMDKRVGQLEALVGSASTSLDETSPLPPPLLPQLTRLSAQLALLTQPRHVDAISRRLKLLLSDLDRASSHPGGARRGHQPANSISGPSATQGVPAAASEQLAPVLSRLAPLLPHIPAVLARLRTLGALHASAAGAKDAVDALERDQVRYRAALEELSDAVDGVEKSLKENRETVRSNVLGLEERVTGVLGRLEELEKAT